MKYSFDMIRWFCAVQFLSTCKRLRAYLFSHLVIYRSVDFGKSAHRVSLQPHPFQPQNITEAVMSIPIRLICKLIMICIVYKMFLFLSTKQPHYRCFCCQRHFFLLLSLGREKNPRIRYMDRQAHSNTHIHRYPPQTHTIRGRERERQRQDSYHGK